MSAAEVHGIPHEITWRDKTYKISPFFNELVGMFEQWLKRLAWREVEQDRPQMEQGHLAPHLYQERHLAVSRLISGGEHKSGGPLFRSILSTDEGIVHMLYLCVWDTDPQFTEEQALQMYQEIPEIVLSRLADLRKLPNSKRGATSPATPTKPVLAATA